MTLYNAGIPLTLSPMSFEGARPQLGEAGKVINSLVNKSIDYNIVIIQSTPEFWDKKREDDKINVGFIFWETTKIHPDWEPLINTKVDKLLVSCEWNKEVVEECGITIPIGVVPNGIDTSKIEEIEPYVIKGVGKDAFIFYSIMQWTERKNPLALLKAYWYAFQKDENVALVLKTYRNNYSDSEKQVVRDSLIHIKKNMPMDSHAKIYLISDMLSNEEINGLHAIGDCYASLDRGEGFGLCPFAAGAFSKPIIVTGFGGVTEYAKPDNSYLVDYQLTPVSGMWWTPWYKGDQLWAQPSVLDGANKMRHVFNNREEAADKGKLLGKYIKEEFNFEVIGQRLIKELEDI
jgi:glycosyltransferase involved in cell wall biosynthesis